MWVDIIQSVGSLNRIKILIQRKEEPTLCLFELEHCSPPSLGLGLILSVPLILRYLGSGWTNQWLSCRPPDFSASMTAWANSLYYINPIPHLPPPPSLSPSLSLEIPEWSKHWIVPVMKTVNHDWIYFPFSSHGCLTINYISYLPLWLAATIWAHSHQWNVTRNDGSWKI